MSRRSLSNLLSNEERNLPQIWGWYEFQRALIEEERSRVHAAISSGSSLTRSRHVGKTSEELDNDFAFQTNELGQLTMLGMLACTEAALRVDLIERVSYKKKDDVSRRFRKRCKERGIEKIRLEEDILETWKEHGSGDQIKAAVGHFKGALKLRHWLAHGRYWRPKLACADEYDPVEVFDICKLLLLSVGLMPADTPGS